MLRLTIFLMAVAACALYFAFRQQATQIPSDVPEQIAGIPVHTKYIPQDSQARSGRTRAIHYIVIHETDNTGALTGKLLERTKELALHRRRPRDLASFAGQ